MNKAMLALTASLTLVSCASLTPRARVPDPPKIDCSERAPANPLPATPRFSGLPPEGSSRATWIRYVSRRDALWGGFAVRLFGAVEDLTVLRAETADCLDRERAAGRIR